MKSYPRPQEMKENVEKHRNDLHFVEEDLVYIEHQPYRQTILADRKNKKLSKGCFGPYQVIQLLDMRLIR